MYTIEPDAVLDLCKKHDGYDGAVKALHDEGIMNPKSGKPYTKYGVRWLASQAAGFKEWRKEKSASLRKAARENTKATRKAAKA